MTQSDAPDPLQAGGNITYSIRVQNLGPNAATGVNLSNPLPPNPQFVSFTAQEGWHLSPPAVGGTGTVASGIASLSAVDGLGSSPYYPTAAGDTVFFSAESSSGHELWKSDCTAV